MSTLPWAPMPMPASVVFSLGAVWPGPPSTCRGTTVKAAAAPVRARNLRRGIPAGFEVLMWFMVMSN